MRVEPEDCEWRSVQGKVGRDVLIPYYARCISVLPKEEDSDDVIVSYLAEEEYADIKDEIGTEYGGEPHTVQKLTASKGEPVPLIHGSVGVTAVPSKAVDSIRVYYLGIPPKKSPPRDFPSLPGNREE